MTNDDLDQQMHLGHAINNLTLEIALVEAGVLSKKQLELARAKVIHIIDQWAAEEIRNSIEEAKENNPEIATMIEKCNDNGNGM